MEVLVVLLIVAFWMVLTLEEAAKSHPARLQELCRAGRVRLRQTLDVYRGDSGSLETFDRRLVDETLLPRGYLSTEPRCPKADEGEFPFAMAPDGTVTCARHPEGAAAETEIPAETGKAHRTFFAMVIAFGRLFTE